MKLGGFRQDRGAAAVEFAVIVPLLLLILLFVIDGGRVFFVKISLLNSSSQAARAAALGLAPADIEAIGRESAPGVVSMSGSGDPAVTVSIDAPCPGLITATSTDMAVITSSIDYVWSTPLALLQYFDEASTRPGTITVSSSSEWLCQ